MCPLSLAASDCSSSRTTSGTREQVTWPSTFLPPFLGLFNFEGWAVEASADLPLLPATNALRLASSSMSSSSSILEWSGSSGMAKSSYVSGKRRSTLVLNSCFAWSQEIFLCSGRVGQSVSVYKGWPLLNHVTWISAHQVTAAQALVGQTPATLTTMTMLTFPLRSVYIHLYLNYRSTSYWRCCCRCCCCRCCCKCCCRCCCRCCYTKTKKSNLFYNLLECSLI